MKNIIELKETIVLNPLEVPLDLPCIGHNYESCTGCYYETTCNMILLSLDFLYRGEL